MGKWEMVRFGDVCIIERGGSPRPIDKYVTDDIDGINWIKIGDTTPNSMYITHTKEKIIPEGMKKSRYVKPGDFLLSNSMSFGRPYILKIDGCIHDGWLVIRDENSNFDKRFLFYYLSSDRTYAEFKGLVEGGVVNNLNSKMVRELSIPLPPLPIQQKIADILDRTSALIEKRKEQIVKLDLLVKSQFAEMFGNPMKIEKNWAIKAIKEFATVKIGPFGSLLHAEDYIEDGVPIVNPSHIKDGKITIDPKLTVTTEKYRELSSYAMQNGDIVLGRRGEIGRCAVVGNGEYLCGTGSMFIRMEQDYLPIMLQRIISSDTMRQVLEDKAVGVTMLNLNAGMISGLEVIMPPLDLQNRFAEFVQQVEKSKFEMQQGLGKLELLYKSLMQKCFGGELF